MTLLLKEHIAKKVLSSLTVESSTENIRHLLSHLHVAGKNCHNFISISLQKKPLEDLQGSSVTPALVNNIKTDHIIKCTTLQRNTEGEESLSFCIPKEVLMKSLWEEKQFIEQIKINDPRKLLVEYSSPNVAKPFHMGHLRSTIVGNFVANILEISNEIVRINYLGDWGTQVGFINVGLKALDIELPDLKENPLKKMYEAYVKANSEPNAIDSARESFAKLEKNEDKTAVFLWEKIQAITLSHLQETYCRLGINFDEYSWESNYKAANLAPVIQKLRNKNLLEINNSQLCLKSDGKMVPFLKSDNSSLYLSRDIAAALDRISKYNCDSMIYVVDKSQAEHLQTLKYAIENVTKKPIIQHVPFGRVTGMSTRKGTSIFLSDILDKAYDIMAKEQAASPTTRASTPEVTNVLAVSALAVYMLRQRRLRDFKFDWTIALQSSGDTGVKLQYVHCRLTSLEKHCGVKLPEKSNAAFLTEESAVNLLREISRFEDVLAYCELELESSPLLKYLFNISNLANKCLKTLPVKGCPTEIAEQRLLLFHLCRRVVNKGMRVLGLTPLEEM